MLWYVYVIQFSNLIHIKPLYIVSLFIVKTGCWLESWFSIQILWLLFFFLLMYVLETDTCTLLSNEHNYVCLEIFILSKVFIYNYKSYVKYEQQTNKANMTHDPSPQKSREKKAIYKKDQLHAQKVLTLQSFCVLSLKIKQESSTVTNDVAWRFLIKFKIFKIIMYISLLYSKTCEIRGKRIYIHFINLLDFFSQEIYMDDSANLCFQKDLTIRFEWLLGALPIIKQYA